MLNPKLGLITVFGRNVNAAFPVDLIDLFQHGGISALSGQKLKNKTSFKTTRTVIFWGGEASPDLWEVALLVNERHHVQGFGSQHIQGALVVLVVDARPHDVFPRVLLLLQLENVPDKELLQLLVGEIDA